MLLIGLGLGLGRMLSLGLTQLGLSYFELHLGLFSLFRLFVVCQRDQTFGTILIRHIIEHLRSYIVVEMREYRAFLFQRH